MNYAKLINGAIQFAPNPILVGGNWIGNPPGEIYAAEGYKPVTQDPWPAEDPQEGYYWSLVWTEDAEGIYGTWQQVPFENDPE